MLASISAELSVLTFFFFNDTATTEIYTLSLHDALPISGSARARLPVHLDGAGGELPARQSEPGRHDQAPAGVRKGRRSEEHTSELQSQSNLVCRLLLEKKKKHMTSMFRINLDYSS